MMAPLGSEGGVHETMNCSIPEVADKPDTGLGTLYNIRRHYCFYIIYNYNVCIIIIEDMS